MYIQNYDIHLINGEVLHVGEDYELSGDHTLVAKFRKASDDAIFQIGDEFSGYVYVPKRSIVFISTGDVRRIDRTDEADTHYGKPVKTPNI